MSLEFVQGDTGPVLGGTIVLKGTTTPVNLTGATVKLQMRKPDDKKYTVDAAATVVSPTLGTVSYAWSPNDLSVDGTYQAQWEVSFSGGVTQTTSTEEIVVRPQ